MATITIAASQCTDFQVESVGGPFTTSVTGKCRNCGASWTGTERAVRRAMDKHITDSTGVRTWLS